MHNRLLLQVKWEYAQKSSFVFDGLYIFLMGKWE